MKSPLLLCIFLLAQNLPAQVGERIYISSRNTNSIKYFHTDGTPLGDFVTPLSGGLSKPQDLFFHPHDGTLIVTGIDNDAIKKYAPQTGEFLGDFSSGYPLDRPTKMAIGPDSLIYVSQWGAAQNKVVRFGLDGVFVDEFTAIGIQNGCGMAWDADSNLYVSFYGAGLNGGVHKFAPDGTSLGLFINSDILDGPVGIWQNNIGEWLVTDWTKGTVERFDSEGAHLGTFISGLANIEGHAFDGEGKIYLCDWSSNLVARYNPDGSFDITFISSAGLAAPNSIIFGPAPMDTVSTNSYLGHKEIELNISPNPFTHSFVLSSNDFLGKKIAVQIFSSDGKTIWEKQIHQAPHEIKIDAAHWPSGTYSCQITIGSTFFTAKKIMKK